ncbi:MAG: 3-dehydroquinate synthase family protein, partial [bacterium]
LSSLEQVYSWLASCALPRNGVLIGIGGGAVLDLAGLAASTWTRGIRFIAVPTTLLAMVDAAIGGKTAINTAGLKNPVGTFHPASTILADPAFLATLPRREWRNGLAELIKTAIIGSARLCGSLEKEKESLRNLFGRGQSRQVVPEAVSSLPWPDWIGTTARIKARIVQKDFQEAGLRRVLNLGHTLGHALEARGGFSHGEAVSIGLAAVFRVAASRGLCRQSTQERLADLLLACGLPITAAPPPRAELARLLAGDKKKGNDRVRWVLPERFGKVRHDETVSVAEILAALPRK